MEVGQERVYSKTDVEKILGFTGSRQTLLNLEKAQKIPSPHTQTKGRRKLLYWKQSELPELGSKIGFLKPADELVIFCTFTEKGGVLKSTLTYTFARTLALCGMKVLIVGLESQGSITHLALNPMIESIDDIVSYPNVYDLFLDKIIHGTKSLTFDDVARKTTLENLHVIPENERLKGLKTDLAAKQMRHTYLSTYLLPEIKKRNYDVVLFDNGSDWNLHLENALFMSDYILSPIGCDPGTYQANDLNSDSVQDFGDLVKKQWKGFFTIPTLKENNKVSKQIYGSYLSQYADTIVEAPIRRLVAGTESFVLGLTPSEYSPKSPLAEDYHKCFKEIWSRVINQNLN